METENRQAFALIGDAMALGPYPRARESRMLLARLGRFHSREWLDGAPSREASDRILGLIWAATGDAYIRLARPLEAADAYARSTSFHPMLGVFDAYAPIVLRYKLERHYSIALRSAIEGSRINQSRPFSTLLLGHWLVLTRNPLHYAEIVWAQVLRGRRRRKLEALARGMTNTPHFQADRPP